MIETKLACAMFAVQGAVSAVHKDKKGNYGSYASLDACLAALRPHLQEQGIVLVQKPLGVVDGLVRVLTTVIHAESGQSTETLTALPLPKADPQGVGSATTYACRYALMAMFALPPTDDDADSVRDRSNEVEQEIEIRRLTRLLNAARENFESVARIKSGIAEECLDIAAEAWSELDNETKQALWVATTKGGIFTTNERHVMRSEEFRQHSPNARPE